MEEKMLDPKGDQKNEYDQFEVEAGEEIAANAEEIEKLKNESPGHSEGAPNQKYFFYYRNLTALEQKNNDLKAQLNENKFDDNWREFKSDFKSHMKDLTQAFKKFVHNT